MIKTCMIQENPELYLLYLLYMLSLRGVSGFDVYLFLLKNIPICCKLEILVNMAIEQG